jgi:hypothetical protein
MDMTALLSTTSKTPTTSKTKTVTTAVKTAD